MNGTTRFLATVSEDEKGETRNACNEFGYESVALVPIRIGTRILGLIHIADTRENMVPLEMVEVLEGVAMQLGGAIERVLAEEKLKKHHDHLEELVEERTAELMAVNEQLQQKISDYNRLVEALRISEANFKALAENANDGILIGVGEGAHIYANKRAAEITGYSVAELLQTSIKDLAHPDELKELMERYKKRLRGEPSPRQYETVIIRKDGRSLPIELTAAKTDWNGQPADIVILRDVTRRKRAEEELRENEERFRTIFELAPIGIDIVNEEGRALRANLALQNILGFTEEELRAKQFVDYTYPEDVEDSLEAVKSLLNRENDHISLEKRYVRKDGAIIWARTSVAVVRDNRGDFRYFIAMVEDITQRKQMEEVLRESEERFRTIVETAPCLLRIIDTEGNNLYISPNCEEITGYTQEELLETFVWWIHEDDMPRVREIFERALHEGWGGRNVEYKGVRKNGDLWYASVSWAPFRDKEGKLKGFVVQTSDISKRKQVEEKLRRARQEWENIFQAIGHPTLILDPQHNVIAANRAAVGTMGMSAEELLGRKCYEVFHGTDRPPESCPMEKMLTSAHLETVEMEIEALGGIFLVSCTPMFDHAGHIEKVIHIATDITDHKRMENSLSKNRAWLEYLITSSPAVIYI
ncbi:PAS domain S-box protein [bacterium]|nr:PAS domain S-box protein [bacterium]